MRYSPQNAAIASPTRRSWNWSSLHTLGYASNPRRALRVAAHLGNGAILSSTSFLHIHAALGRITLAARSSAPSTWHPAPSYPAAREQGLVVYPLTQLSHPSPPPPRRRRLRPLAWPCLRPCLTLLPCLPTSSTLPASLLGRIPRQSPCLGPCLSRLSCLKVPRYYY